jgi:hypothetical protein
MPAGLPSADGGTLIREWLHGSGNRLVSVACAYRADITRESKDRGLHVETPVDFEGARN